MTDFKSLSIMAEKLRIHSIEMTNASKSGHPTTCASMAEILSVLFFDTMKLDIESPRSASSDRFVLSKGHAAPILYAAWAEAGLFPTSDLLNLRKIDSDLEGHPTPRLNFIDVATGSLGQGLSVAAGMAFVGKYIDRAPYRVYCLIGDGESAEGSIWEALHFAAHYKLDNLVAIFDINRLGQSEATSMGHLMDVYNARLNAFGFETKVVDGHDVESLAATLKGFKSVEGKPQCVLAQTYKGKGFVGIEDQDNWHGKPIGDKSDAVIAAIKDRIAGGDSKVTTHKPECHVPDVDLSVKLSSPPDYKLGEKIATRQTYGTALVKLGQSNPRVIALDGDTKNSTFSETYKKAFPDRYIECFIAEQNLVGVGIGAGCRGRTIPFVSTFASFFSRTFDQIRMGAISQANIKLVGSHCGVSIGEDGPSQMALEDLAMFRSIPNSLVFYPSDAVSTERACELAAQFKGIVFIRTSRPATPVVYANDHVFAPGKSHVFKVGPNDTALLIGAGITFHESMDAADKLKAQGVNVRVMDLFSIKPLDKEGILAHAKQAGNHIVVTEDHYPEGGLGEAVALAVAGSGIKVTHLCVRELPRSGPPAVLIEKYGIGSKSIVAAVKPAE